MARSRQVVLGIDAGASKTHALAVAESGQVLGFGRAGTGNHQARGLQPAVREIERAARAALGGAASAASAASAAPAADLGCFCLAGADLPEDYTLLQAAMESLALAGRVLVKNDTAAVLRSGLTRGWGVAVICGTGFNAGGRAPDGREIQLAGLGPISGDWGGGAGLATEMIRMVMRAWDGRGQATQLTSLVLDALHMRSHEDLLAALYHNVITHGDRLSIVPLLFDAAQAGDEVACDLVVRMGTEIGVTAAMLIRRLDLCAEDVEVVLGGGVSKGKGPLLLETVAREVRRTAPRARIVRPRYEPVVGAALLALESAGVAIGAQVAAALEGSLPSKLFIPRRPHRGQ